MNIDTIDGMIDIISYIRKIKFEFHDELKIIYWRFIRNHIYMYTCTDHSASVKSIDNIEMLKNTMIDNIIDKKGMLKIKYADDKVCMYNFT